MKMNGGVKILCTGDLHLGRHPSRVPVEAREHTVAYVWEQIVELAIEREVDLVVLTGDVVDRENRYYEAMGPLERGVRRLGAKGIPTYGVAGNHDFDVLPRLADTVGAESFHLLGRGGQWESLEFEREGVPVLRIVGWSFPAQHFHQSPLEGLEVEDDELPTIGILHADLDQRTSRYAPLSSAELGNYGFSAWLLGHIHKPSVQRTSSNGVILYPGSPQALSPGERGKHGPWLVEVAPHQPTRVEQIPMATVRYHQLAIDLSGVDEEKDFRIVVSEKIHEKLQAFSESGGPLKRVVLRLIFSGRTKLHRQLTALAKPIRDEYSRSYEGITAAVEGFRMETTSCVDLEDIARGNDPPAVLAKLLVELQTGTLSPEREPLFGRLREQLNSVHRGSPYTPLRSEGTTEDFLDEDEIRELVINQGMALLDQILAQKNYEEGA